MTTTLAQDSTAARVRAELGRRGLPDAALCPVLGLSRTGVMRRLQGSTDWSVTELLAVAGFLGVAPVALLPEVPAAA
jgi:hypothetical protein